MITFLPLIKKHYSDTSARIQKGYKHNDVTNEETLRHRVQN